MYPTKKTVASLKSALESHDIKLLNELAKNNNIAELNSSDKLDLIKHAIKNQFVDGINALLSYGLDFYGDDRQHIDDSIISLLLPYDNEYEIEFLIQLFKIITK